MKTQVSANIWSVWIDRFYTQATILERKTDI